MIDLQQPLDLDDPGAEEFLAGIQGNIVDRTAATSARSWCCGWWATPPLPGGGSRGSRPSR